MNRPTIILTTLVILLAGVNSAYGQELQYVTASMWATAFGVKVVDSYACCAFFSGLIILDITDPQHPVEASRLYCQGNGLGVDVSGDYAFLADERAGLQIIDVSDPHQPFIAACYDTPGQACDVTVRGSLAYVMDGPGSESGLVILDVSEPTDPVFLGNFSASGASEKCEIAGDHAYLGGVYYGLDIVDISDPTNPHLAIRYEMCSSSQICVRDTIAYVTAGCGGGDNRTEGSTVLYVLDVSDPCEPVPMGEYYCEGWATGPVQVAGGYAYIRELDEDGANWIVAVDVSDPSQPTRAGATKVDGYTRDLQIEGETLYAAMEGGGFQILDITTATDPVLSGVWWEASGPDGIAIQEDIAYVADGRGGLRVLDISNPESPVGIAHLSMPGVQRFVQVLGDRLYLVDFVDRFSLVDVSDPGEPRTLSVIDTRVYGAYVCDGIAYLAEGSDGLFLYDISDPEHPAEIGWCAVPGHAWDVIVSDGFAYVCAFEDGLQIVDVSDPAQPVLRGGIDFDYMRFKALEKVGNHVFVPAGNSSLFILDVSDPDNPVLGRDYPLHTYGDFVRAEGDRLFVGTYTDDQAAQLAVLDISNPLEPVEWMPFLISGVCRDLAVYGEYLIAPTLGSLLVLRKPAASAQESHYEGRDTAIELHLTSPTQGRVEIRFATAGAADVRVDLIDVQGRCRARLYDGQSPGGEVHLDCDWRAAGIEGGAYFLRASTGREVLTRSVTLVP